MSNMPGFLNFSKEKFDQNISDCGNMTSTPPFIFKSDLAQALVVCYTIEFLLGSFGNCIVLMELWKLRKRRRISHYFIGHLSLADLLVLMLNLPFRIYYEYNILMGKTTIYIPPFLSGVVSKVCFALAPFSAFISVFTLVCMAWERHQAIVRPLKPRPTKGKVTSMIAVQWLIAFLLIVPLLLVTKYNGHYFVEKWPSWKIRRIYSLSFFMLQYFLPLTIITVLYSKTMKYLRKTSLLIEPTSIEDFSTARIYRLKRNVKICKTFGIIVSLFAICLLPNQVLWLWLDLGNGASYGNIKILLVFSSVLFVFQSCVNPLVYGTLSLNLKYNIKCCKKVSCCTLETSHQAQERLEFFSLNVRKHLTLGMSPGEGFIVDSELEENKDFNRKTKSQNASRQKSGKEM